MRAVFRVFVILLPGILLPVISWAADPPPLQNGVPFNTFLNALTYANVYIDVPSGATKLTVTVTNGTGDLDLYLKFGSQLTGGTLGELQANSDARSESTGPNESITLTTTSNPPVKAGKWYIATLNLNNVTTNFTLTAGYEGPSPNGVTPIQGGSLVSPANKSAAARSPIQEATFPPSTETKHTLVSDIPRAAIPGSTLNWMYSMLQGTASSDVDMYLILELTGGPVIFLGDQLPWDIVPVYKRNFPVTPDGLISVMPPFALPSALPWGDYNFYALLVRAGNIPYDAGNWASDVSLATMHFSPLSPQQEAMISNYGYPSQFIKAFHTAGGMMRIDEVWAYGANSMGVSFINGAFEEQISLSASGTPTRPGGYKPENYRFDMTAQDIIGLQGQPAQIMDPSAISVPEEIVVTKFYGYDGITFGFNNE